MRRPIIAVVFLVLVYRTPFLAGEEPPRRDQAIRGLVGQLAEKDPAKVCAAAKALGQQGSAPEAVPPLRELLRSRNARVKWSAAEALWRLEHRGAELVPVYAELLTAKEADVRAASAWRLGRLGSAARPAVPVLAASLRDEDLEVRVQVGQALANLGPFAEPALPALIRALGDENLDEPRPGSRGRRSVRRSPALPALVELAEDSIPLLLDVFHEGTRKAQQDPGFRPLGWDVAARVAIAMPAIGGRAVPPLLRLLESREATTRAQAVMALNELAIFNGLSETAIDRLEKCLDDPDLAVRREAAQGMSWARSGSTRAAPLLATARDLEEISKLELLNHLKRMAPHNAAALKLLIRMLEDEEEKVYRQATDILTQLDLPANQVLEAWMKALFHTDKEVRLRAIQALEQLGSAAKPSLKKLYERFHKEIDSNCKGAIVTALPAIDPDDPALVSFLIGRLDDPSSSPAWSRSVASLSKLGSRAKAALPRIEQYLLEDGEKNREEPRDADDLRDLITALLRMAPDSARTPATLLKVLRQPNSRSRISSPGSGVCIREVLEDGLQATLPGALPLLREALKDRDIAVRQSAALVLVRAGLEIETTLPVLTTGLWDETPSKHRSERFQERVVDLFLRRQASVAPVVAREWCKAWQTASPRARRILERGLLVLQPEALPHLLEQLRQAKTTRGRRDLAHLLAQFEGQGQHILGILREELRDSDPAAQHMATHALVLLGPDAAEAVPELIRLLGHSVPGMRATAASAIGSIGRAARAAVPALKAMLTDDKRELRLAAALALSRIDPEVSEALSVLRAVSEEVGELRYRDIVILPDGWKENPIALDSIEEGIARFGERGITLLAEILDNVDLDEWSNSNLSTQCGSPVRVQAALLLAKLGPDAKAAVPALIRALKDKDPFVRDAAASALGHIGPAARSAAPDFIGLLEQQNRSAGGTGAWINLPQAGTPSRTPGRIDYGGPFDFRSAGRQKQLFGRLYGNHGYGMDPYGNIRAVHPYDPAHVLSRIDTEARSALPILREMARDPNHPGRLSAALALWRMGDGSDLLLPAFSAALESHARVPKNESEPFSQEIQECLVELGSELKPVAGVMASWLRQSPFWDGDNRIRVLDALGRLGGDARMAAEVIRPLIQGDRWQTRRRVVAALALFRITGEKEPVLPVLREVLLGAEERGFTDPLEDTGRVHAGRALGVLADRGDERARALLFQTAKGDDNPHVRIAALEALGRHKQTQATTLKGLTALLSHPEAPVRLSALQAIGRLGDRARHATGALELAAEDARLEVRLEARRILESLR